jgi:hypothetical protein
VEARLGCINVPDGLDPMECSLGVFLQDIEKSVRHGAFFWPRAHFNAESEVGNRILRPAFPLKCAQIIFVINIQCNTVFTLEALRLDIARVLDPFAEVGEALGGS